MRSFYVCFLQEILLQKCLKNHAKNQGYYTLYILPSSLSENIMAMFQEPGTRTALNILKNSYKNNAAFILALFEDTHLKQKIRLICFDVEDLHQEYILVHKMHEEKQFKRFQSDRSCGKLCLGTASAMMTRLISRSIVSELKIGKDPAGDSTLIKLHWNFLLDLCGNRLWSQAFFSMCFPWNMAMIFAESDEDSTG